MTARKENPQKASKKNPLVKPHRNPKSDIYLVREITEIDFIGNVIPLEWFKHITVKTSKKTRPHLLAINILADVVYWYKGIKARDERSGQAKGTKKKFKGYLLQRSYGQIANTFGVSKEQARTACHVLESHGLIYCHFKNIESNGRKLINVMYIEPYPHKIKQITHGKPEEVSGNSYTGSMEIPEEGSMGKPEEGLPENPKTYTETTNTENSITKNSNTETVSDEKKSETEQTKDPSPSLPEKLQIPSQSGYDAFEAEYKRLYMESQGFELDGNLYHIELIAKKLNNDINKLRILLSNFPRSWWGSEGMRPNPDYVFKFLDKHADAQTVNYKGKITAAQRDKFGGDDVTVQKIANEAVRRAEEEAAAYLANGGLTF